jgi:hypothetical protein
MVGEKRWDGRNLGASSKAQGHVTLWLFNMAMENGLFIDGLPIKKCDFPWLR